MKILHLIIIGIFYLFHNLYAQPTDSSVVSMNGQLGVKGNKIVNQYGEPIILRGMSLFWSQWMPQYYNANCIKWLKEDWKCTVVRAAMGIESGGYLNNPDTEKNKIRSVIDACVDEGIYVIVDWHDHHANEHLNEAIAFFKEIASEYGDKSNIIYEIFNEPEIVSWQDVVKPYSDSVISAIRSIDSNNLILVGNPTWSQDVDIAANDPLNFSNIAYSLHFYAASHKQYLRDKAKAALTKGVALFVSEFGTCESNGSGFLDYNETEKWITFLEENKISWCNWSIADKVETSAALVPGASGNGGWDESQITESGKLIKDKLIQLNELTDIKIDSDKNNYMPKINSIQNYPNPFNSSTIVKFSLAKSSKIKMSVFNMLGENVFNVIDANLVRGQYSFQLDFSGLPSGNYLISYQTEHQNNVLKMQYIK